MERAFSNRTDAGRLLAEKLEKYANRSDVVVLGLPRGGVPVACEVAKRLRAPLDVFIVRKLGMTDSAELDLRLRVVSEAGERLIAYAYEQATREGRDRIVAEMKRMLARYLFA